MVRSILHSIAGAFSALCLAFAVTVILGITFTGWP